MQSARGLAIGSRASPIHRRFHREGSLQGRFCPDCFQGMNARLSLLRHNSVTFRAVSLGVRPPAALSSVNKRAVAVWGGDPVDSRRTGDRKTRAQPPREGNAMVGDTAGTILPNRGHRAPRRSFGTADKRSPDGLRRPAPSGAVAGPAAGKGGASCASIGGGCRPGVTRAGAALTNAAPTRLGGISA